MIVYARKAIFKKIFFGGIVRVSPPKEKLTMYTFQTSLQNALNVEQNYVAVQRFDFVSVKYYINDHAAHRFG